MKTNIITGEAMVGKNVAFTTMELTQMSEVLNKIETVINNHLDEKAKKIYLSDDDLYRLEAIFMCILETEHDYAITCFDRYEKSSREAHKADIEATNV